MDTAIATFQAYEVAAITPKRGKIKPVDIFSLERREIDEKTVTDLMEALVRDGRFLQDIAVRDEGASGYRLIFGANRLEAWKRQFGKLRPIPADIYPTDTPDALITAHEFEENDLRKQLTKAERMAGLLRYAAARQELEGGKPVTPASDSGQRAKSGTMSPSLPPVRGGRGNKGMAQKIAEKLGISKRSVNRDVEAASAAIREKIDLDHDTAQELKRKAAELEKAAEPKVEGPKRRKPTARGVTADPTPGELQTAKIGSPMEGLWNAFEAIGRKDQLRFIHDACLHLGLDPLLMASPAVFGLADEEAELGLELPAEVAPSTDAAAGNSEAEHGDKAVVVQAEKDDEAAAVQANQGDNGAEFGAADLQDAVGDDSEAADPEIGVTKCGYCRIPFESGDQLEEFNGKLFHSFCVEDGKRLAKAKQGKQIAIAA